MKTSKDRSSQKRFAIADLYRTGGTKGVKQITGVLQRNSEGNTYHNLVCSRFYDCTAIRIRTRSNQYTADTNTTATMS